jgi:hypothetical protein
MKILLKRLEFSSTGSPNHSMMCPQRLLDTDQKCLQKIQTVVVKLPEEMKALQYNLERHLFRN